MSKATEIPASVLDCPAFPVATSHPMDGHQCGPNEWQFPGMTLRDYFAGQALAGYHAHPANDRHSPEIARYCYDVADAMLKARANPTT